MNKLTKDEKIAILQEKFGRKELSFGCLEKRHYRNQYDEGGNPQFDTVVMYVNEKDVVFIEEKGLSKPNMDFWCSKKEVLGHPITLSDVLKAIREDWCITVSVDVIYDKNPPNDYFIDGDGLVEVPNGILGIEGDGGITAYWDLSKNLLRDQSAETIDKIFEILIPKS